mmetsp:Transcript_93704/g.269901  ORF Transcript_93704/g.269901 Transcript_93704/m.269901 type:complete len:200 (+) Transcript_93704:341-940(+)
MSNEFLTATWRKSGFVGCEPDSKLPATMGNIVSADEPGEMSATASCCAGARPNGFLLTWIAKPPMGTLEALANVMFSLIWPPSRVTEAMTPKPVLPVCPACVGCKTGAFGVGAGAEAPPPKAGGESPPPSRSNRSSAPPPPLPDGAEPRSLGPRSSSSCTSRRRAWRSSSSTSSSSPTSSSRTGAAVARRVTNSSAGRW